MKIRGKVWKYGSDVDTDVIIPARYLTMTKPEELAVHAMEDLDPEFVKKISPGDIMVAGKNFGCGSSREHAPVALKAAGISCVVARNFARIFYRNSINVGFPILECPEAADEVNEGETLEVDAASGLIRNLDTGREYRSAPFPPFIQEIISLGGLKEYVKRKIAK